MSDDDLNYDSFIGGIVRTDVFKMPLKRKTSNNSLVDAVVSPYILPIQLSGDYPQADIILDEEVQALDIGIKFQGKKYSFRKNSLGLVQEEMETDFGLYLPLALSKYSIIVGGKPPLLIHVLGLDSEKGKSIPLFLLFFQSQEHNGALGFSYSKNGISTFLGRPVSDEGDGSGLIYCFDNWHRSMLEDRIKIPSTNLEEKLQSVNILPKKSKKKEILEEQKKSGEPSEETKEKELTDWKDPKAVIGYLDKYVMEQNDAKKRVAISLKKYRTRIETKDESIEKANLLLIGPTGTGKTYIMSLLAKGQNIPFVDVKVTGKSQTGYVGENLTSAVFDQLFAKVKPEKNEKGVFAPAGIVFLDEFDKLGSDKDSNSDMFNKLQQEIVGWTEDANISVGSYSKGTKIINTKNLLFVGAGAFSKVEGKHESLMEVARKRMEPKKGEIGFGSLTEEKEASYTDREIMSFINEEDLEKFGLMPELIGRFPERAILSPLSPEGLAAIFSGIYKKDNIEKELKNSVYHSYKKIMEYDGYKIEMDEKIPMMVAEKCSKETGARAVKTLAADIFDEIIFEPEKFADKKGTKTIKLTPEMVYPFLSKACK